MDNWKQTDLFQNKGTSTSSAEATRVSRFPSPDVKAAKKIRDTCGRNTLDSLGNYVHVTPLEKTWVDIFDSVWIPSSRIWTARTTPRGALVLKLRVSAPRTGAKESSGSPKTWPTPRASSGGPGKNPDNPRGMHQGNALETAVHMYPTPRVSDTEGGLVKNVELENGKFSRRNKKGVRWGVKLKDAVNHLEQQKLWPTPTQDAATERTKKYAQGGKPLTMAVQEQEKQKLWPTPTTQEIEHPNAELTATGRRKTKDGNDSHSLGLADQVQLYPTPLVRDWKGGRTPATLKKRGRTPNNSLPDRVNAMTGRSAQLNPGWVTALMGFPRGWTAPGNTDSTGSASTSPSARRN